MREYSAKFSKNDHQNTESNSNKDEIILPEEEKTGKRLLVI